MYNRRMTTDSEKNKLFQKIIEELNKISLTFKDVEIDVDYIDPYGYDECSRFFYVILKNSISINIYINNPDKFKYKYHSICGKEWEFNSYRDALEFSLLKKIIYQEIIYQEINNNLIKSKL